MLIQSLTNIPASKYAYIECQLTCCISSCFNVINVPLWYITSKIMWLTEVRKLLRSLDTLLPQGRCVLSIVFTTVSRLDVTAVMELLRSSLQDVDDSELGCPRVAPSVGVVTCTYRQWFLPFSRRRRDCQLPVSARRMHRFLQFRLGSHSLPIATGRIASGHHLPRSDRVCSRCGGVFSADELHMVFECPALALIRQNYAELFTLATDSMRSFFAQDAHMQVFKFILDCLDFLDV